MFGKSIKNMLVCKFDRVENIFSIIKMHIEITYWYVLPHKYFILFNFHFSNSF